MAISAKNAGRIDKLSAMFKEIGVGTALRAAQVAITALQTLLTNVTGVNHGNATVVAAGGTLAVTGVGFQPTAVQLTLDSTTPGPATAEPTVGTFAADGFTIAILGNDDKAAEACNVTNCKVYWTAWK